MKYDDESSEGFWHIENSALLVVKYWLSRILHEPMAEYKEIEMGIKIKFPLLLCSWQILKICIFGKEMWIIV